MLKNKTVEHFEKKTIEDIFNLRKEISKLENEEKIQNKMYEYRYKTKDFRDELINTVVDDENHFYKELMNRNKLDYDLKNDFINYNVAVGKKYPFQNFQSRYLQLFNNLEKGIKIVQNRIFASLAKFKKNFNAKLYRDNKVPKTPETDLYLFTKLDKKIDIKTKKKMKGFLFFFKKFRNL